MIIPESRTSIYFIINAACFSNSRNLHPLLHVFYSLTMPSNAKQRGLFEKKFPSVTRFARRSISLSFTSLIKNEVKSLMIIKRYSKNASLAKTCIMEKKNGQEELVELCPPSLVSLASHFFLRQQDLCTFPSVTQSVSHASQVQHKKSDSVSRYGTVIRVTLVCLHP